MPHTFRDGGSVLALVRMSVAVGGFLGVVIVPMAPLAVQLRRGPVFGMGVAVMLFRGRCMAGMRVMVVVCDLPAHGVLVAVRLLPSMGLRCGVVVAVVPVCQIGA